MNLKTFSQLSRRILIKGVEKKLLYWGFDAKGGVQEEPQAVEGGYLLRGEGYDDPTVLHKWAALRIAIQKKGMETVTEEAAYTWFNRFMAIRILSKNQYDQAQLEYEGDSMTPTVLAKARRGQTNFLKPTEKQRLQKVLTDYSKEKEAFAILMIGYCDQHQLLRSIFGRIDDYTELLLPDDTLEKDGFIHLLNTTDAISEEDYQKVELIGWLYQFYISEKKDQVFASFKKKKKAEAKDIPAATQIFTPNWIVKYMVQNTVGKLWLDLHPNSAIKEQMAYLIHDEAQTQAPIISEVDKLKLLDPAVGSGHILVEGFDLLYGMYMEEYYTVEEAVASILKHNLFGLDIDNRAVQLAKFAVLLKAAKYYPEVLQKGWMPQIYAMPEPYPFSRQEVLDFLGKDGLGYEEEFNDTLRLMQDAQNLGSALIIDLSRDGRKFLIRRIQELEKLAQTDLGLQSVLHRIRPYIQVIAALTGQYESVAANPPYMGQGNMNATLKNYINSHYPLSKSDLFAVFMEVSLNLNVPNGLMGMINQHSWMFLSSYEKLRDELITKHGFLNMLHLGPRTFEELSGEVVQSTAFVVQKSKSLNTGNYVRLVDYKSNKEKEKAFLQGKHQFEQILQINFSKIPGSPIAYWVSENFTDLFINEKIENFAISDGQNITGDNEKYLKNIWEINSKKVGIGRKWVPCAKGGSFRKWFGNILDVIDWSDEARFFYRSNKIARIQNEKLWFRRGITWNLVSSGGTGFRLLEETNLFNKAAPTILFESISSNKLEFILAFLNTKVTKEILKVLNPTFNTNIAEVLSLPLISLSENLVKISTNTCLKISKSDWDSKETSREFNRCSLINGSKELKFAFQTWRKSVTEDFFLMHQNEEELNHIFINIYGLQEEVDPEVHLTEITILQDELDAKKIEKQEARLREKGIGLRAKEMGLPLIPEDYQLPIKKEVVMKQLISYAIGVNMGRYHLDKPGLNIAYPDPSEEELVDYSHNGYAVEIDEDGIIPLMGTGCTFTDDAYQRVRYFLEVVWGEATLTQNLNFLQECLDEDLESYLVKKFWADHCKTYKKKPIYWLFGSKKGAFQVLAYMHRMNAFTVEKIRSNYLMPHLKHLRSQIDRLESSKEDPRLLDRLQKNLDECESYDLLLKDTADKQISFDLDDGVSKNYALFEGVVRKVK